MNDLLKKALLGLGVAIVVGIAVWLTDFGGLRWIISLFHRPRIQVVSTSRGEQPSFVAGEVLRFSLKDVVPDRVVWDFEETDIRPAGPGAVETEHAFPFDPKEAAGLSSTHRVDAFYREGSDYKTASTHVSVSNVQIVSTKVQGEKISFSATPPPGSDWVLDNISLAKFENGTFTEEGKISAGSFAPASLDLTTIKKMLGLGSGATYDPDKAKGVAASLEFESPDRTRRLYTVQNLDSEIKEMQGKSQ
jgi:hypothetical protein